MVNVKIVPCASGSQLKGFRDRRSRSTSKSRALVPYPRFPFGRDRRGKSDQKCTVDPFRQFRSLYRRPSIPSSLTAETGEALAEGIFPESNVSVRALETQTNDPLFHPVKTKLDSSDSRLAYSALAGRIGNDPQNLTEAHREQLFALDKLLETCGTTRQGQKRISLFEIPSTLSKNKH